MKPSHDEPPRECYMLIVESRVSGVTPALLEQYRSIDSSTLGHLTDEGYLPAIKPLFRPIRLLGNAVTVRLPPRDGSAIRAALIACRAGDVLVIEMAAADQHRACWGELRTLAAMVKAVAGVVIAGAVTDVAVVTSLGFPVFSMGISAITTSALDSGGEVNRPVRLDDTEVRPGDLVIGDDDGLFILSPRRAQALALSAQEKQRRDATRRRELAVMASPQIIIDIDLQ